MHLQRLFIIYLHMYHRFLFPQIRAKGRASRNPKPNLFAAPSKVETEWRVLTEAMLLLPEKPELTELERGASGATVVVLPEPDAAIEAAPGLEP